MLASGCLIGPARTRKVGEALVVVRKPPSRSQIGI